MLFQTWEANMPVDSILVSIAVCGVFLLFAVMLAWVEYRTTSWQRSRIAAQHTASAEPPRKKAA